MWSPKSQLRGTTNSSAISSLTGKQRHPSGEFGQSGLITHINASAAELTIAGWSWGCWFNLAATL